MTDKPRQLVLIRHAKAVLQDSQGSDIERKLRGRGKRDAEAVGAWLRKHVPLPDVIYASTARRVRETLERILRSGGLSEVPLRFEPDLYTFSEQRLQAWLSARPLSQRSIWLVGHNPALQGLVKRLCPNAPTKFPTAACAWIELPDWDAEVGVGKLRELTTPKNLP